MITQGSRVTLKIDHMGKFNESVSRETVHINTSSLKEFGLKAITGSNLYINLYHRFPLHYLQGHGLSLDLIGMEQVIVPGQTPFTKVKTAPSQHTPVA